MSHRIALACLILLPACDGGGVNVRGYDMTTFFPLDGTRSWEFTSVDEERPYRLLALMDAADNETVDGVVQHHVRYERLCIDPTDDTCTDGWERTLTWSSAVGTGVQLHRVETPEEDIVLDPPLVVAEQSMTVSESTTTGAWTSTFEGIEPCEVLWTDEWDQCAIMVVEGDGSAAADAVAGTYRAVTTYGVVGLMLDDDGIDWRLSYATFDE